MKEEGNSDQHQEGMSKEDVLENKEEIHSEADETAENVENEDKNAGEEKDELTILQEKNDELNDKFLRLYSEFENFRRRTAKERMDLFKTAGEEVITSMLPVLDDFERAMKAMEQSKDMDSVREGINLIYQKLQNTLGQKGLKAIESSVGKEFDVNMHEAISQVPAEDKKMKGKVLDELEKGYMLHEKVIRYTKVVIGA